MKYNDEDDKCLGIAGMAIGISIWNGEGLLYQIDLDNEDGDYISFTPDYYFSGNPALSPVDSWHATLKHYQMTVGMLIANLMSRSLTAKKPFRYVDAKKAIFAEVAEEGKRSCQLEDDEIRQLFQETYGYLEQVFSNQSVRTIAQSFAARLKDSRRLTNYEVKELLGILSEE